MSQVLKSAAPQSLGMIAWRDTRHPQTFARTTPTCHQSEADRLYLRSSYLIWLYAQNHWKSQRRGTAHPPRLQQRDDCPTKGPISTATPQSSTTAPASMSGKHAGYVPRANISPPLGYVKKPRQWRPLTGTDPSGRAIIQVAEMIVEDVPHMPLQLPRRVDSSASLPIYWTRCCISLPAGVPLKDASIVTTGGDWVEPFAFESRYCFLILVSGCLERIPLTFVALLEYTSEWPSEKFAHNQSNISAVLQSSIKHT